VSVKFSETFSLKCCRPCTRKRTTTVCCVMYSHHQSGQTIHCICDRVWSTAQLL